MEPIYNLNEAVPADMRNLTMYYTACKGDGLIDSMVNDTISSINEIQLSITNMSTTIQNNANFTQYCPNNTIVSDLDALNAQLDGVIGVIDSVTDMIGCENIQPIMFSLINDCLCTEMYTGIFFLWGSNLWTNLFLFIVILVASYVWPYYAFWNENRTTPNEFDGSDDGGHRNAEVEDDADDHFLRREVSEFGGGAMATQKGAEYDQIRSGPGGEVAPTGIAMVDMGVRPDDESNPRDSANRKSGPKKVKNKRVVSAEEDENEAMI
jgi:hypothetical protein